MLTTQCTTYTIMKKRKVCQRQDLNSILKGTMKVFALTKVTQWHNKLSLNIIKSCHGPCYVCDGGHQNTN